MAVVNNFKEEKAQTQTIRYLFTGSVNLILYGIRWYGV